MHAREELALFGADPQERVRLHEEEKLARRFAEECRKLRKHWAEEMTTSTNQEAHGCR